MFYVSSRFAPSPTGSLHVGGARTALFNWLIARQTSGTFIVRVEDTDEARSTRASEDSILRDLRWMGLAWDEGPDVGGPYAPYRQSERRDIYQKFAQRLIEEGHAYRCFETDEELSRKKEAMIQQGLRPQYDGTWRHASPAEVQRRLDRGDPYTVRFRVPPGATVTINDTVRGLVTWDADSSLGDFVLLRSNGMPVYNFCVAIDDVCMKISHVIRAEEHLTNTLRQVLIFNALGYKHPVYAHCSLILGSDRSKLSKRHGAASLVQFANAGFLPSAMMNYLANLGWNDGGTKEIYSPNELIQSFSMDRIVKSPAVFDMDRLRWINSQHLRSLDHSSLKPIALNALLSDPPILLNTTASGLRDSLVDAIIKIAQPIAIVTNDFRSITADALSYPLEELLNLQLKIAADTNSEDDSYNATLVGEEIRVRDEILRDDFSTVALQLINDVENGHIPNFSDPAFAEAWKQYTKALSTKLNRKGKRLFHPIRLIFTGRLSGPDVGAQLQLLHLASNQVGPNVQMKSLVERIKILRRSLDSIKLAVN
jgi:glutamyl-tRNA synthetase